MTHDVAAHIANSANTSLLQLGFAN